MTNRNTFEEAYNKTDRLVRPLFSTCLPNFWLLDSFYGENHRYYHNRNHILELLNLHDLLFDNTGMTLIDGTLVEIAIWFHDIIYQPCQTDNELRSALIFDEFERPYFKQYDYKAYIYQTILHTTHFKTDSHTLPKWSQYMLDLDLAGFGSEVAKFNENTLKLRLENSHVNNETFDTNRLAFLKKLVTRERPLYYNPYKLEYFEVLEKEAQKNIADEMTLLMTREYHP